MGPSEVKGYGEEIVENNNNMLYCTPVQHFFLIALVSMGWVSKKWKNNARKFISYSDRLAVLKFYMMMVTYFVHTVWGPGTSAVHAFYSLLMAKHWVFATANSTKRRNAAGPGFYPIKLLKTRSISPRRLSSNKQIVNNIEILNHFKFSSNRGSKMELWVVRLALYYLCSWYFYS